MGEQPVQTPRIHPTDPDTRSLPVIPAPPAPASGDVPAAEVPVPATVTWGTERPRLLWRVVVLELAVAAVVVAGARGDWTAVLAVPLALLTVLLLVPAVGAWARTRVRYALARAPQPGAHDGVPELAGLQEVLPRLSISSIGLRGGSLLGVCADGAGWAAVLAVHDGAGLVHHGTPARLPVEVLARLLRVDDIRLAAVQVVTQASDNPLGLPTDAGAVASYRMMNPGRVPGARQTWIVLRIDATTGASAINARGGGRTGAERALKRCVARASELLAAAEVTVVPLGAEAAASAIAHLSGLTGAAPEGMRRSAEHWRNWEADGREHVSWRVRSWPVDDVPVARLVDAVAAVPAFSTATSITLEPVRSTGADGSPGPGGPAGLVGPGAPPASLGSPVPVAPAVKVQALVRLTGLPGEPLDQEGPNAPAARLTERLAAEGFGLTRLDGRHRPALLAGLPLARVPVGRTTPLGRAQVVPTAQLTALDVPVRSGGLTVGTDTAGEPVLVRLFRPTPVRIYLMTSGYVAKLLAYRSAVAGASVEVVSPRESHWSRLVEVLDGRARPVPRGAVAQFGSGLTAPLLRIDDAGLATTIDRSELGAWQTRLVLQDRVTRENVGTLRAFDLVMVQRLRPEMLALLAPVLGIPAEVVDVLPMIPDDVVALLGPGTARLVNLSPTWSETNLFGQPVRLDG
ncbi:type VII secretion protein EccE [Spongisporangium articulatum]|uniref:Type VII secretion protein EccE n=1 Tax=Spongisporangium articulatum TaxID=3362603 RepID=A0ABW8ATY5_9ACTN